MITADSPRSSDSDTSCRIGSSPRVEGYDLATRLTTSVGEDVTVCGLPARCRPAPLRRPCDQPCSVLSRRGRRPRPSAAPVRDRATAREFRPPALQDYPPPRGFLRPSGEALLGKLHDLAAPPGRRSPSPRTERYPSVLHK